MAINILVVVIGAVIAMAIGMFWYSPAGFGNQWMKLSGMSKKDIEKAKKKGMGKTMLAGFISALVKVGVLAIFVEMLGKNDFVSGAMLGFWVWLGFVATESLSGVLWENKPLGLYFLNNGYNIIIYLLIGGILGVWA